MGRLDESDPTLVAQSAASVGPAGVP
jgi:hypothetical protein